MEMNQGYVLVHGVNFWKFIRQGWLTFSRFLQFDVGDGTKVKFLHDVWCDDCPLKVAFPKLFSIGHHKEASINDVLRLSNGMSHQDVRFSRLVQDWELEPLVSFFGSHLFQACQGGGYGQTLLETCHEQEF